MRTRVRSLWIVAAALLAGGCGSSASDAPPVVESAAPQSPREKAQALAQVLSAFEAHGGQAGFDQLQRCRLKSEITVYGDGGSRRLIWEDLFEAPSSLRRRVLDAESGELLRESLLTDRAHWGREPGGPVTELPLVSVDALLPPGVGALRLVRRAQHPQTDLLLEPASAGTPAAVRVVLPDEPEAVLSFAPESHLLTRARQIDRPRQTPDSELARPTSLEIELGNLREWGALKIPTQATARRDGQKLFELTLLEFEPLERTEAGTFRGLE